MNERGNSNTTGNKINRYQCLQYMYIVLLHPLDVHTNTTSLQTYYDTMYQV